MGAHSQKGGPMDPVIAGIHPELEGFEQVQVGGKMYAKVKCNLSLTEKRSDCFTLYDLQTAEPAPEASAAVGGSGMCFLAALVGVH